MPTKKAARDLKIPVNSTLSPTNVAFLDELVSTGEFPNRSAAINHAIHVLKNRADCDHLLETLSQRVSLLEQLVLPKKG